MKFNVQALIERIDRAIEDRARAANDAHAATLAEYEQLKADYLASEHPDALRDAARKIVEKVRKGRIVTSRDVEPLVDRYRGGHFFSRSLPRKKEPNTQGLVDLREFLKTVTDEEVSSTGLRDVGFRNLGELLGGAR